MDVFQVVVALAVIAAAAGIAMRAAHEPVSPPKEAASVAPPQPAPRDDATATFPSAEPVEAGAASSVGVEVVGVGVPVLNPDPDRLIQTEIILPVAEGRGAALVRLVLWILLTGSLIGLSLLGALRGIGALFG